MAEDKKPFHQRVAEECIEALRNGTAPWITPWEPGQMPGSPVNALTGKAYRGINRIMLAMQQGSHIDPRWCTYKQAQELGAQVKKGEKGTTVQYWKFQEERLLKDEQGKPLLGEDGQKRYSVAELERPRTFYATVFHASQIENLPPLPERATEPQAEWERHQAAERLLAASNAKIFNDQVMRAYYQPSRDEIHLPPQGQFTSPDKYYATALHELGHWSGHESRLDRDIQHPFGSEGYAREELRAEIASYMLGADLGIGHDPGQHHAYVASWIKVLEQDPREIIRAAQDAERLRGYVMGLEREHSLLAAGQELAGQISRRDFNAPERAAVQEETIMAVTHNPEQFFDRYQALEQSYGGRFINSDLFKETIPQYAASKESRNLYNTPVHNTAAVLAAEQFKRVLAQEAEPGKDAVYLVTGIPGAGKSTSLQQVPPDAHAVYEGQLADPRVAQEKVQQVLDAGFKPVLVAVHVQPEQALNNALDRFEKIGRPVSIEAQARIQGGLPEGLAAVRDQFGDQAELHVIDRRDFTQPSVMVGWEHLNTLESEGNYEHIKERLAKHLEQRKPELSEAAWRQASGLTPAGIDTTQARGGTNDLNHEGAQRSGVSGRSGEAPVLASEKTWLNVPYKEKNAAKEVGAKWDGREKRWYAPEGADLNKLATWLPGKEKEPVASPAVLDPREEFSQTLLDAGFKLESYPVMDGTIHRVAVMGGKPGAKDGAYCGYEDGRPNGWYQNHKTGQQGKWVANGHMLSETAKTELRKESAEHVATAEAERQEQQEKAMKRAYAKWTNANAEVAQEHPYLNEKGIAAVGVRQDKQGNLVVPGFDLETGRIQTVEYINQAGAKWYEKGCPKKGAMAILPDKEALKDAEVVLMVEGYATGVSVHQATGLPVAVAFDAGNIKDAARAIKQKMPNARITICADNDPPRPDGTNIGVMRAKEAAAAVPGCKVVVADFSQDEKSRGLSDFNDLHKARGLAAVKNAIFTEPEKIRETEEVER